MDGHWHHRKNDADSRMIQGVYVGNHERTGAALFLTPGGLRRGQGIHRLPEADRFDMAFLQSCKGLPWDLQPVRKRLPKTVMPNNDPDRPTSVLPTVVRPDEGPRKLYILKSDIERWGPTDGCVACTQLALNGKNTHSHSDDCRSRIREVMARAAEADEKLARRLRADETRHASVPVTLASGDPCPAASPLSGPRNLDQCRG